MTTEYKNILIIKPSALGDIVHALPVVSSLRQSFPNAKLTWMVRTEFAPLLHCAEGLDEILLFDRKKMGKWFCQPAAFKVLRDFWRKLKTADYDLVLDLQGLFRTGLFAWMTGCPRRVGMSEAREGGNLFYNCKVPKPDHSIHVLDYYHAVMQSIGIEGFTSEIHLNPPRTDKDTVAQLLEIHGLSRKDFIVLIPSSAHAGKCWPAAYFAEVADYFCQQHGIEVIIVGSAKDQTIAHHIKSSCKNTLHDMTGRTSIPELVALLSRAKAVISNDTGPGYIAEAVNVPTVIIYGPTNPQRLIPYQRPECMVAIDPYKRGTTIANDDPAYQIDKVPVELVLEKINAQFSVQK